MGKKIKYGFLIGAWTLGIVWAAVYFFNLDMAVLSPKGWVGIMERDLLLLSTWLMLLVVVPVFFLVFLIIWKYRASNPKAKYTPDWDYDLVAEAIWWGIPCAIIAILSYKTWTSSHELDPFRPIESEHQPVKIQVVALQWKWMFIYPEENVASINEFYIPENIPVVFDITADAPMNSFWIPQLGGQVFAMSGMRTKLHLIADKKGSYKGCSANISGKGFAGMNFVAEAGSEEDYRAWIGKLQQSGEPLDIPAYRRIAEPSEYDPPSFYRLETRDLFDRIIMKYMMPGMENLEHKHGM